MLRTFIYVLLAIVGIIFLISFIWRYASRFITIPCPSWLSLLVELENPFAKAHRAHTIIEYLDIKGNMQILDAGCGPGRLTLPLAQKLHPQGQVTAMDVQSSMLQKVKEKSDIAGITNIQYLNAPLGSQALEKNFYDRALLAAVLGEIPEKHLALKELFDALKPGGILSISETIFDPHYQTKATVAHLIKSAGFSQKTVYGNYLAYTMLCEKK